MSRANEIKITVLFWSGVVLALFAITILFFALSPTHVILLMTGDMTRSCGFVWEILVHGVRPSWSETTVVAPAFEYACRVQFNMWGAIAIGSAVVGAALITGATKWARRIYREDYPRPVVSSNGASTS